LFSPRATAFSINKTDHQGITDTLLKVALTPYNRQTHSGMGDVKQYLTQIFLINDLANLSSLTSLSIYIFTIWICIAYNRFCRDNPSIRKEWKKH
jgi:hypothetical protein